MTKEYFLKQISGKLNTVIAVEHFPDLSEAERQKVTDNKEARFRRYSIKLGNKNTIVGKSHPQEVAYLDLLVIMQNLLPLPWCSYI